jgi:hypothetical protein
MTAAPTLITQGTLEAATSAANAALLHSDFEVHPYVVGVLRVMAAAGDGGGGDSNGRALTFLIAQ